MERMVSPGVFTEERDQSFLPQGIAEIGATFIGPTQKGPAFQPTIVDSQQNFEQTFGVATSDNYTAFAVQEYLKNANRATVVRVLGLTGYDSNLAKSILLSVSGAEGKIPLAVIHPSIKGVSLVSGSVSGSASSFTFTLSGSTGTTVQTVSANPLSSNYIGNVLGFAPTVASQGYVYVDFPRAFTSIAASGSATIFAEPVGSRLNFSGSALGKYSNAFTPWIQSQTIGAARVNLFRFGTFSDGDHANTEIKVSISNVRESTKVGEWGTFSVLVRNFDDTDNKLTVLESFDNLNLDPESVNYVFARIGTSKPTFDAAGNVFIDGEYPARSRYVYLEGASGVGDVPVSTLPFGFGALKSPLNEASVIKPAYVLTTYQTAVGSVSLVSNTQTFFGINLFDNSTLSFCSPVPVGSVSPTTDLGFSLEQLDAADLTNITNASSVGAKANIRKFTVPFQGGFDGLNPSTPRNVGADIVSTNTMGYDLSDSTSGGSKVYAKALAAVANPDEYDINMIVLPGVIHSQHAYVTTLAISVCQERQDCFYIVDPEVLNASVDSVTTAVQGLDSTYAGAYYPWVKIRNPANGKLVWVPPSVVIPGVFAFNDRVGAEWFVPAGLTRGGIDAAVAVKVRLDHKNRDILYEARINPIAVFPSQGIVAWGNTTLQSKESALSSINIRRLLIAAKKFIASSSRYLVFEQNVDSTRQRFLNIANPYFASVQERRGLYAFQVRMDDSNNSNEMIDRKVLVGEIFLQPTRAAEKIALTFNVLPTGAVFPKE